MLLRNFLLSLVLLTGCTDSNTSERPCLAVYDTMVKDMQTVQVNSVVCKTLSSCSCDLDLKYGIKVSTYYDCGGVRYLEEYWPNDSLTFYKWSRKDGILIDAPLAVKGDFYLESCFGDVNPFTNCFVLDKIIQCVL